MEDIDMSRPGVELFPENAPQNYSSYTDENLGQAVDDPLTGENYTEAAAQQPEETPQQRNFKALRDEVAKMKEEREYWKGQAEAYRQPREPVPSREDAFNALDWDDAQGVRKAFEMLRDENKNLRTEIKDALTAIETKTNHSDWNNMVTQHVPELTSTNPIFAEMIKNASNPYEAAYALGELNSRTKSLAPPASTNGQRAIQNAQKPQTLASVGGKGHLSAADYYASMSDKDFMELASKNLANI